MAESKFNASHFLSDNQNSQLAQGLREYEDCVLTGTAELYANYISDRERKQHFSPESYGEEGWVRYRNLCAVCFIKENKMVGFQLKIYDVEGNNVNQILELPVNYGFVFEFEPPGNIFLFGQTHQLCLHFLHNTEGKQFQEQLVKVGREWKLEKGASHAGSGLVDKLATKILRGKEPCKGCPEELQDYKLNKKEQKIAAQTQEKYNQALGKVQDFKKNVKDKAENMASDYKQASSLAAVTGYVPGKLAEGKKWAADHVPTKSLAKARDYIPGKLAEGKRMVTDHLPSTSGAYEKASKFVKDEQSKSSLLDKVKKLLHKRSPTQDTSNW